jgi:hypothetical protein
MLHKHVPTVIYKRSGTVLYLCIVKYYLSFCFLNFIRDVLVIEYNKFFCRFRSATETILFY